MSRPHRRRRIHSMPNFKKFGPKPHLTDETIDMSLDEYETIRLIDYSNMTQAEAAKEMEVARTTVQHIYKSARFKISESLVLGKTIIITGGHYRMGKRGR